MAKNFKDLIRRSGSYNSTLARLGKSHAAVPKLLAEKKMDEIGLKMLLGENNQAVTNPLKAKIKLSLPADPHTHTGGGGGFGSR